MEKCLRQSDNELNPKPGSRLEEQLMRSNWSRGGQGRGLQMGAIILELVEGVYSSLSMNELDG